MEKFKPEDYVDEALILIAHKSHIGTPELQRYLGLGYTGTAAVMKLLEERGLVGPHRATKPREVL